MLSLAWSAMCGPHILSSNSVWDSYCDLNLLGSFQEDILWGLFRDLPASAFHVLELNNFATISCSELDFFFSFYFFSFFFFFFFFGFFETGFLCVALAGSPGTHFVDQAGLKLRNPPASASRVLELKACATMPGLSQIF